MVAVVSGYGLGLFNTTTIGLGNKTEFGQGKESIKINAVTGNLILQQKDDALISQGIDAHLLRTYNSQGLLNDANGDNFRFGFNQQLLGLTGEINQPNSTIERISADGATTTYTYNTQQQCYISTDGSGAHDKLKYLGDNHWCWTEGSSLITETYHWQNNQGRLITRSDRHGFKIQLEYQHDKVVALRDEQGQTLSIEYTGNNVSAIHHSSAGHSSVKTRYHYDQLNRLTSVIVDLTAEDNSITDNHVYKTQYQYDGDSRRIAHIKQSDGTALTINYQQGSDGQFRVSQITEGKSSQAVTTRYVYDLNARKTDIIQVNNATSGTGPTYSLWYDEQGRLTRTANPADTHGFRLEINYQYDNDDNLLTQTDNTGRILSYTYDQYGNRTTEIDAEQNKITRTFNSAQQKISETIYPKGDTQQGVSQYWVYDEKQRISFHINAEGFLEAYQYQSWGDDQLQQTTTLTYLSAVVPVENFSPSSPPSNTTIKQWLAQQTSLGHNKRKDQYFDFRGQLHKVVQSQALNQSDLASTQPNASNILNTTYFIYDTYGQLIKSVDSRGQAPAENPTIPTNEIQHNKDNFETLFVYDGLGRLLASTNSLGETTRYQYQDQLQQVLKTAANGLQTTELYDSVGRIINRTQIDLNATAANNATLTHTFLYDKQGRKIAEQDPSGAISLSFYHRNGQPVATVDAMGYVTEYFYNKTGKQIAQRRYATALSVNAFAALQVRNNEGTLTGIKPTPFESIRPSLSEHDRITRQVFAKNNQLRFSIDGEGAVTEHRYDQAGRKILTIQHAKTLNTPTDLNAQSDLALNITAVQQQLGETLTADDRVQRFFYSKSGQLSGMLDAEGYLTRYGYTATGERSYISQLASRVLNPETDIHQWLTCSLSELQVTPSDQDQHALNFYNAQGWVIATVDAEGYLTCFAYDAVGNKTLERRLATQLTHTEQTRLINWAQGKPGRFQTGNDLLLALIQQKQTEQDQLHSYKYDAANRLREETDAQGNTHRYQYNSAGQVIHTTKGIMLAQQHELLNQARTSQAEYDGFGRLIKTTNALGAETLFRYDSAGRKTQQQDAAGHITRFYYDQRERLTHTINALGEVSAVIYNAFDHAISTRVYITRLTPEQLTSLEGGIITSAVATLFSQLAKDSDAIKRNRYNRRGQITEKIDAENNSQQLNYNAFGELNSITQTIRQSLSITQTQYLTYNRRGEKVTTSTSVLQGDALLPDLTTHYTLDAFGRTTQTTNAIGHTTTFEYDRLGRQLSITSPNQSTSHTSYDAFNRVLSTTDARGNTTAYQYQKTTATNAEGVEFIAGHQVIVTTPTGLQKITEKNLQGENVRITAPDNTTTEFFYDKAGNLIKTVDALGQETTQQFNQLGWKTAVTQADGLKVHYEYDAVGRQLIQITDPNGLALKEQVQYDALGNKVQVTDANNTLTQHHYNRNGQLTKTVVDPEGLNLITAYEYDNSGNQIRIQQGDANGWQRVTEHRFNGYGQREATIIDPEGLKLTTRFYYDDAGQLIKKINAENHATQYVYDNVGRLRFTINPQGAVSETQYDNNGNKIAEINYKNAVDASLTYTEQELTAALNSSEEDQWQGLIYDADNRLTFSIDGLGYLTKIDYNKNNQVIAKHIYKSAFAPFVKQTNLSVAYIESRINNDDSTRRITTERVIYDALGQTKFKANANGWLTEFQYDQAGRVIAAKRYNVTWQQLELNNNTPINTVNEKINQWQQTAKPEDIHHESHWYDNAGRRLYTQDAAGYLTGYRFDALGQVVAHFKYKTPAPNLRQSRADINQITQHLSVNSTIAKANYSVYDTAGRKRFTVNDLGYVTEYRYNAVGESITTLRYPQPIAKEHVQNLTAIREGLKQTPIVVHGTQLHEKSNPVLESGLSLVNGTYGQTWEAQEVGSVAATSNWVSKTIKPNQPYKLINSAIKTWSDKTEEAVTLSIHNSKTTQSSSIINHLWLTAGPDNNPRLKAGGEGFSLAGGEILLNDSTPTHIRAKVYNSEGKNISTMDTEIGKVKLYRVRAGGSTRYRKEFKVSSGWNGQVNLVAGKLAAGHYKAIVTATDDATANMGWTESNIPTRYSDGDGEWTRTTEVEFTIGTILKPTTISWSNAQQPEGTIAKFYYRDKGFTGGFLQSDIVNNNNQLSTALQHSFIGEVEYRIEYINPETNEIVKKSSGIFLSEDNKTTTASSVFHSGGDWAENTTGTAIKGYVSRLDAADIQYLEAQVVNKKGEVVSTALTHPDYITQQLGLYDGSVNLSVGEPLTDGDYQITITRHFKDNRPTQTESFNYQIGEQPYQAQQITVDAKDLNLQPGEKLVAHYRLAHSEDWQAIPFTTQGDKLQLAMPATALTTGETYQLRVQRQSTAGQPQAQLLGSFSAGQDANVQFSHSRFTASAAQSGTSINGLIPTNLLPQLQAVSVQVNDAASGALLTNNGPIWTWLDQHAGGQVNISDNTQLPAGAYQLTVTYHFKDGTTETGVPTTVTLSDQTTTRSVTAFTLPKTLAGMAVRYRPISSNANHSNTSWQQAVIQLEGDQAQLKLNELQAATTYEIEVLATGQRLLATTQPETADGSALAGTLKVDGQGQTELQLKHLLTNEQPQVTQQLRDSAGRVIYTVDAMGYVTAFRYDHLNRIIQQTQHATPLTNSLLSSDAPLTITAVTQALSHQTAAEKATNQIVATYYDAAGHQQAQEVWQLDEATTTGISPVVLTVANSLHQQSAEVENQHWEMRWIKPDPFTEPKVELYPVEGGYAIKPGHIKTVDDSPVGIYVAIYDMAGNVVNEYEYTPMGGFENWKEKQPDGSVIEKGRWIVPAWQGQINLARKDLAPGQYKVKLSFIDNRHDEGDADMWSENQWTTLVIGEPPKNTEVTWNTPKLSGEFATTFRYRPANSNQPWQSSTVSINGDKITAELVQAEQGEFEYQLEYRDNQGTLIKQFTGSFVSRANSILVVDGIRKDQTLNHYNQLGQRTATTNANGHSTYYAYNAKGQLSRELKPTALNAETQSVSQGSLIEYEYDALGRKVLQREYLDPFDISLGVNQPLPTSTKARVTRFSYDAAGQLSEVSGPHIRTISPFSMEPPPSGLSTTHQYDYLGRQVSTTEAAGTDQQRTTQRFYNARGLKVAETQAAGQTEAITQLFKYDALGQLSATTDGRGSALVDSDSAWALAERARAGIVDAQGYGKRASALTASEREQLLAQYTQHQQLDSLGRKISQTDASGHTIQSQFDAFGNLIQSTDARGAVRHFFYDANNRLQLEVDAAGYATHYTYTASDHVAQKTRYQQALDLAQVHPQADVTKLLEQLDKGGVQQQTRFEYDAAGRVTLEHDGTYQQTYQYDGVGNKTAHTDKNGYTSYFEYNAAGQLTRKQSPKVQVVTDALAGKVEAQHLITTHRYDALGRKTAATEAAGTALAATTLYEYDAQDRLIKEVLPSRTVLQLQTNGESQTRTVKPELSRVYDLAGNLIQHTDGNGNRTTYYFNAVNQKVAEVTANGVLTQFEYDAAGNMIRQRVYDDPVSLPVDRHQPPQPNANASFRETHTQFDAQNRELASTAQRGLFYSAEQGYFEGQQRTQNQFDANGNLTVKVDANGQQQFTWYDAKNQAVLMVDTAGYVTQQTFDGAGNLIKSHRYAQPLPQTLWRSLTADTPLSAIEQGLTPSTSDRITTHRYNAQNQRVETRLLGIQHNEVLADGQLQQGVADQVTTYGYDALGHQVLISKFGEMTTANGEKQVVGNVEQRQQQFDALGRQTTAQNTHFSDASGAQVTPTTVVGYNALGQTALQVQKANANTATYDLADQDLITRHHYDAAGLLRKTVDANGAAIDFHYDAQGNVVRKDEIRTQADGAQHTIYTRFGYDALNREVSRIDAEGTTYQTHYNSHGQVTEKIINGQQHEFFEYDQLGRLVKTNQQTGATRLYGYDQNGNMTLQVASAGADLSQLSLAQLRNLDLKSDTAEQLAVTVQRYDARNQLTDVIQPEMTTLIKDAELTKVDEELKAKPFNRGALAIQGGERFQIDIKLYGQARRNNYPAIHYHLQEFHVSWQGLEGYTGKLKVDWNSGFNPNAKGSWIVDASAGTVGVNMYSGHWWRNATAESIHHDGIYYHINVYKQDENQQWELLTKLDNRYQWNGAYHSYKGVAHAYRPQKIHQLPRLMTLKDQPRDASRVRLYYRPKQEADYATRPYNEENYNPAKYTHYVDGSRLKVNETTSRWGFDLTNAPGLEKGKAYEYYYEVLDHKGRLANRAEGIINWGGSDNTSATHSNTGRPPVKRSTMDYLIGEGKLEQHAIHRQQRFNAFGEIIAETDGLGNKTAFSYNKLGKLTEKQSAAVSVTHANGFIEQLRPTTHYHTDLQGRTVGVTDANGHTNTQQWLEDRVVKEFHADGGVKQFHYDAFGRKQQETNELGQVTQFHYDHAGNLLYVDRAGSNDDHYTYDEAGNRTSHTNALGHKETYRYDGMGRVRAHTDNLGHTTQYDYQWDADIGAERFDEATDAYKKQSEHAIGGWRKTTTDAEGNQRVDHHDLYNRIRFHRDMGGRQTWYDYNQAGWLVAQRGDTKLNNDKHFDQEIHYRYYNNGYIKGIDDLGINAFAEFQYDANGNLTFEGYSYSDAERGHEKVYTQRSFISYDAANRIDHIKDEQYELRYEYDAVGNRRRVFSRYLQPNGLTASQDFWYAYDAMNRFTITQGQLSGERATDKASHAVNVVAGDKGYAVTYNALGQRTSAQHGQNHEAYAYDANGFLSTTHINDELRARRINDAAGNASEYLEYKSDGNLLKHVRNTYNANNRKIQEHTVTDGNNTGVKYSFDKAGNLKQSVTYGRDPELTTRYTYELWDDYKQKQIELKASTDADLQYDWAPGFSFFEYDANGHVSMARDDYHQRIFRYVNNHKGQVLRRTEKGEGYLKTHNYYYVNGLGVGDVGDDGPSYTDYATQLALSEGLQRKPDKITPVYSADFDANYQPISADYPAQSPGSYTVNKGDTLQSIARALWGDSSLWFLIADANGIEDPQALKEGLVLTIPNKVTNIHNNSSTYRPYQPGLALGDTSPTLPDMPPPPNKEGACGGAAEFIIMVVAIAAAAFVGPMVAGMMKAAEFGALAIAVGSGAAASAAASTAGQVAGIATGVQNGFSFSQVAKAGIRGAVAGAVSYGVGQGLAELGKGSDGFQWAKQASDFLNNADNYWAKEVVGDIASQGVGMALGWQKKYDWRQTATAGISGYIGQKSGLTAEMERAKASSYVEARAPAFFKSSMLHEMVQTAVYGDGFDFASVAAQTIGHSVGGAYGKDFSENIVNSKRVEEALNNLKVTTEITDPRGYLGINSNQAYDVLTYQEYQDVKRERGGLFPDHTVSSLPQNSFYRLGSGQDLAALYNAGNENELDRTFYENDLLYAERIQRYINAGAREPDPVDKQIYLSEVRAALRRDQDISFYTDLNNPSEGDIRYVMYQQRLKPEAWGHPDIGVIQSGSIIDTLPANTQRALIEYNNSGIFTGPDGYKYDRVKALELGFELNELSNPQYNQLRNVETILSQNYLSVELSQASSFREQASIAAGLLFTAGAVFGSERGLQSTVHSTARGIANFLVKAGKTVRNWSADVGFGLNPTKVALNNKYNVGYKIPISIIQKNWKSSEWYGLDPRAVAVNNKYNVEYKVLIKSKSVIDHLAPNSGWSKPKGWRLPKNGSWQGNPGDSAFTPKSPDSLGLNHGQTVEFRRGFPDFNPYKVGSPYKVSGITGEHKVDMPLIKAEFARLNGWLRPNGSPNASAAARWFKDNEIVAHHDPFTDLIINVPGKLHGLNYVNDKGIRVSHPGVRHVGGAYKLRNQ